MPSAAGRSRSSALMPSTTMRAQRTREGSSSRMRGSAPSFANSLVPAGISRWVESWSDGNPILSSTTTRRPARASGAATAQPAKRAPTTTTSTCSTAASRRRPASQAAAPPLALSGGRFTLRPFLPAPLHRPEHLWVDDQVAEWLDRGHVRIPEEAIRLHVDRHLTTVAPAPLGDPAEVQNAVHRLVCNLGGELVVGHVERCERETLEFRPGRGAQVIRQPLAQRRHPRPESPARAVQAEQLTELPPQRQQRSRRAGRGLFRIG